MPFGKFKEITPTCHYVLLSALRHFHTWAKFLNCTISTSLYPVLAFGFRSDLGRRIAEEYAQQSHHICESQFLEIRSDSTEDFLAFKCFVALFSSIRCQNIHELKQSSHLLHLLSCGSRIISSMISFNNSICRFCEDCFSCSMYFVAEMMLIICLLVPF